MKLLRKKEGKNGIEIAILKVDKNLIFLITIMFNFFHIIFKKKYRMIRY